MIIKITHSADDFNLYIDGHWVGNLHQMYPGIWVADVPGKFPQHKNLKWCIKFLYALSDDRLGAVMDKKIRTKVNAAIKELQINKERLDKEIEINPISKYPPEPGSRKSGLPKQDDNLIID